MAVYVKPNGLLGTAYMAAIRPFRHLIVYPPMLAQIGRQWRAPTRSTSRLGAPARHFPPANTSSMGSRVSVRTSTGPLPPSRSIL